MKKAYISKRLRERVAKQANYRCGYCLTSMEITGQTQEVDPIIPESLGGPTKEENLWLACKDCNDHKGDRFIGLDRETGEVVPLFNPRQQRWTEHFAWTPKGDEIRGLTPTGRATVEALKLNREWIVRARKVWVEAGRHPPKD